LCGVPAVASEVDGIGEIVQEGRNGFLVPAEDTESMAAAVVRLLKDDPLRKTMGEQALHSVHDFSLEKMLKDYSHLYENISAGV
jgi:glycosyltransferase involved in cell wall biosynthesis